MTTEYRCDKCGETIEDGEPRWTDQGDEGESRTRRHFHRGCHDLAREHDEAVMRSKRQHAAFTAGERRRGITDGVSDA